MDPSVGSTLAQYELTALLGEGAMGRVYRARDAKLGRSVAVKLLPALVATDPDRLSRFEREARTLASLNHPAIAALYGFEQVEGASFLVMELVEGETLAERLARGPIPPAQSIALARQIADAIEAAHEAGIVHRDLKPANIKITPDGVVKVLDFGLAKAAQPSDAPDRSTIAVTATATGMILGTPAYMSPEQAKGLPVDHRSDIFSFGCILFEILSGVRPFDGDTVAEAIASTLARDPDVTRLPHETDPRLRDLIVRCLEKAPKRRWQAIGDVRWELERIASPATATTPAPAVPVSRSSGQRRLVTVMLAVVAAVATGVGVWRFRPQVSAPAVQFAIYPPAGTIFRSSLPVTNAVISPDGSMIVFGASEPGKPPSLYIRALDGLDARPLPGTNGGVFPFWSPDSRTIGYFAAGKLFKIDVGDRVPVAICDAINGRGGTWNRDGTIVFGQIGPLQRVSATGGPPTPLTTLEPGQTEHKFPYFLPDGRHYVFSSIGDGAIHVASLDSPSPRRLIAETVSGAIYAPDGHLLFVRDQTLVAQSFDPTTLELRGRPQTIAEGVVAGLGYVGASVSDNGVLAYSTGDQLRYSLQQLTWVDRTGRTLGTAGAPGQFFGIDLSPDERQLLFHRHQGAGGDVWTLDLERDAPLRMTFDGPDRHSGAAVWSPEGREIVYSTRRDGGWTVHRKAASGTGDPRVAFESMTRVTTLAWAAGNILVYQRPDAKAATMYATNDDFWLRPLAPDSRTETAFETPHAWRTHPQVSPDGKWIAYRSDESGTRQLYVRSFPQGAVKRVVSSGPAGFPRWRGDSRELFYVASKLESGHGTLMSVTVRETPDGLELGTPVALFENQYADPGPDSSGNYHVYAVSRDGQRFLIPRSVTPKTSVFPDPVVVVMNWTTLLNR